MKAGFRKGHGSLLGFKEDGGSVSGSSSSHTKARGRGMKDADSMMVMELVGDLSKEMNELKETVVELKTTVIRHQDEIASLKGIRTMTRNDNGAGGGVVGWGGAMIGTVAAIFGRGNQVDNEAPVRENNSDEEPDADVALNEIIQHEYECPSDDDDDEETVDSVTGTGRGESLSLSAKKTKKNRRKLRRKNITKKAGNCGSKIVSKILVASRRVKSGSGWTATAVAVASKKLPMTRKMFSKIKKLVVVCTTLLYLSGLIGQGRIDNSKPGHYVVQSAHLPFSQGAEDGDEFSSASVSSSIVQKDKRSARVLDPAIPTGKKNVENDIENDIMTHQAPHKLVRGKVGEHSTAVAHGRQAPNSNHQSKLRPSTAATQTTSSSTFDGTARGLIHACEGSDPQTCGCASVRQNDYRGSVSTAESGYGCLQWADWFVENYPHAGLQDNNYCRNPDNDDRAWCNTAESFWEYCDIPTCEEDSPLLAPPSSNSAPACEGANPEICGCASVKQADYRGSIRVTKSGKECVRWDIVLAGSIPVRARLEDNNFCRNPHEEVDDRARCRYIAGYEVDVVRYEVEECDVPYCFPPATSCSSSDSNGSSMSADLQAACTYYLCVEEEDDSNDSVPLVRREANSGCRCAYEIWDCEFGSKDCKQVNPVRRNANECCKNNVNDSNWTSKEASCECSIKPDCDQGDAEQCHEFGKHCCEEDDQECKCEYQTRACHLALDGDLEGGFDQSYYCWDAQDACCGDDAGWGGCECDFWEPFCNAYPNINIHAQSDTTSCSVASYKCCNNGDNDSDRCNCDFFTHAVDSLGYADRDNNADRYCDQARKIVPNSDIELESLQRMYKETGGDHWSNNTGWMSDTSHCEWYGVSCDIDRHVIELKLKKNNVAGEFPSNFLSKLYKLKTLDLSDNNLWGVMAGRDTHLGVADIPIFFNLQEFTHVDLSQNNLSGEVDVLFAPALEHVIFSHNNFTSINSFKKFKQSHDTLRICDLSFNSIQQEASKLMKNMPPNLEQLFLSNNLIQGTLPRPLENLAYLRQLSISSNRLSGELPDFSTSFPNLQELNLSYQKQDDNTGFTGTIPESLSNLPFLSTLNLAGNNLADSIPPVLGNLTQLKVLDLSNNQLNNFIPAIFGKLKGTLRMIDLSHNMLEGRIPSEIAQLDDTVVTLNGNGNLSSPAPLSLCFISGFDIKDDAKLCPTERNSLKELYDSTEGQEWTDNANWTDEYNSYCHWQGVTCDIANTTTIMLNLTNNGLSGKLSESIGNLRSLKVLDLSDNDITGSIPSEIGLLSNLAYLRLCYNSFIGNVPPELGILENLELVQLHGNRISGSIPFLNSTLVGGSSFVTDCGNPSDFDESLVCEECTMCCNTQRNCRPTGERRVSSFMQLLVIFFACALGASCILVLVIFIHDKYQNQHLPTAVVRQPSLAESDKTYALTTIGAESVYQFALGTSLFGWLIALVTLGLQLWMLFVFVQGAAIDWTSDTNDLEYTWKCPPDKAKCDDKGNLDWQGWTVFGILMGSHLLKDLINGSKLLVLSAKERHDVRTHIRLFFGGWLLVTVTLFTVYVSTIYSAAIATNNTELVINAVVILFIMDVDEYCYGILYAINQRWVKIMSLEEEDEQEPDVEIGSNENGDEDVDATLRENVTELHRKNMLSEKIIRNLQKQNNLLLEQNSLLQREHNLRDEAEAKVDADAETEVVRESNRKIAKAEQFVAGT